jgi:uncharacterized protein (DUF1501 family)
MAISRRQFMKRGGLVTAGGILVPNMFRNPLFSRALADVIGDRYFLSIFLDGGNDGLNTVTPGEVGTLRGYYDQVRDFSGGGAVGLDIADLLKPTGFDDPNTGDQLGFHPGLGAFEQLYNAGKLAVIQGCGYPEPNLSHDVATTIWETGDPLGAQAGGSGWAGRYLATQYAGADIPGVTIGNKVAGEYQQTATSILAIRRLEQFGFPFDDAYEDDVAAKQAAFDILYAQAAASSTPTLAAIGNGGAATAEATASYPQLHDDYLNDRPAWDMMYDEINAGRSTSMSRDLREVAKIIYGVGRNVPNVDARFFKLDNGGYDTHSDQGGADPGARHYELLQEVGDAVQLFLGDISDMAVGAAPGSGLENLPDKLCIVIWSEFSRRIYQNQNGTDHGSQGPMFLIGNKIAGGVYGNHPNIDPVVIDANNGNTVYSQNPLDPFRSTDFRDVYGTVMKHWMNLLDPSPLLPTDAPGLDPNLYWLTPDFDLPLFLP